MTLCFIGHSATTDDGGKRQVVERQHLACCPKCGYAFNVKVWHLDYVDSIPHYSRLENKPELKECYKKSLNRKIMKIDSNMAKYIKRLIEEIKNEDAV